MLIKITKKEPIEMKNSITKEKTDQFFAQLDARPRVYEDVKRFGTKAMSYSQLQPGMRFFRHPEMEGFVGYMKNGGYNYVLSNPVTAPDQYEMLTKQYLKEYPKSYFCQVDGYFATILRGFGYEIYPFGVEHIIDLDDFKVSWKKRSNMKRFVSRLTNLGYRVEEKAVKDMDLMEISDAWLANKRTKRELAFMARPFEGSREPDTRIFTLWKDETVIGFCLFDPIYATDRSGTISSYVMQHLRVLSGAPNGAADFLLIKSFYQFKEEGLKTASLGLAPLHKREFGTQGKYDWTEILLRFLYNNNWFYRYQQVGAHKDRYHARKVQTYLACPKGHSPISLGGVLGVNNLI